MVNNNYWISYWRIRNTTINIEIRLTWLNKTKIASKNCFRSHQQQYIKVLTLVKINNSHQLKSVDGICLMEILLLIVIAAKVQILIKKSNKNPITK